MLLPCTSAFAAPQHWVVYYGDALPAKAFLPYDVIVFDREAHPPIAPLIKKKKIVLGYISLGEAEVNRSDYQTVVNQGLILDTDAHWKGNPVADARQPGWGDYILNTLIPSITKQGMNGIMLDTTDSLIAIEKSDPKRYAGLTQAAADLIKTIRQRYPHLVIMLNRGFEILPQVEHDINYELAESIYTHWTGTGTAKMVDPQVYQSIADSLKKAQKEAPQLRVVTLDYWPLNDIKTIQQIYTAQRAHGFIPYVTTPDLQVLSPEPK